jgi:hypothetical protein
MKRRPGGESSKRKREYLSSVTLVIQGKDLEPKMITKELRLVPSSAWRAGERKVLTRRNGTQRVLGSTHALGGWTLSLTSRIQDAPLEEQLAFWSRRLRSRRSGLKRLQARRWWCGLEIFLVTDSTASVFLPAGQVQALASLGLDLKVSIWTADRP